MNQYAQGEAVDRDVRSGEQAALEGPSVSGGPEQMPAEGRMMGVAAGCAWAMLILGGVGLLDAATGQSLFGGTFLPQYIPMAVSTALVFLLFGGVLAVLASGGRIARSPLILAALLAGVLVGGSEATQYVFRLGNFASERQYESLLSLLGLSRTPMSPATGALFVLIGAGLALLWPGRGEPAPWRRHCAATLGASVFSVALVLLVGYVFGSPLLYGTAVVPVALTTAAGFAAASVGLACLAGPQSFILRPFVGPTVTARLLRTFLPLVAAALILHPVIENSFPSFLWLNTAVLTSLQAVLLAGVTGAVVLYVGRNIGRSVDEETARRTSAEATALREARNNRAKAEISRTLIRPGVSLEDVADAVHRAALEVTGSAFGFVSTIDPDTGAHIGHTLSQMAGEGQCGLKPEIAFPRGPDGKYRGLWGHALNTGQAFCTNDPQRHPAARGLPEGHVPLLRFMGVPVRFGQRLLGQIALANPGRDYAEADLDAVRPLADLFALGVHHVRSEQVLLLTKENLEQTVSARTQDLEEANARLKHEAADRLMFQQALKESAELYRGVVEDQTEFICRFGADGVVLFANKAFERAFGALDTGVRGRTFHSLLPEDAQAAFTEHLASISPENPAEGLEYELRGPTGQRAWHQWTVRGVFNPGGALQAYQAVGRDVTQAREAEAALRALNERLEEMVRERTAQLEERTESILRMNKNLQLQIETRHRAEAAREAAAQELQARVRQITCLYELTDVLGEDSLSLEEMLERTAGKMPSGWPSPEQVAVELRFAGQAYHSAAYHDGGVCIRHSLRVFGEERGELAVCYLEAAQGQEDSFPAEDLELFSTVQRQVERALEGRLSRRMLSQSESKFREFFDNAAEAIFVHDAEGRILDANKKAGVWLQATAETLRTMNLLRLCRKEDQERLAGVFKDAARGLPVLVQATLLRSDGFAIPLEFNTLALDYQGEKALFSSGRNIAKRLKDEAEILRRLETEALVSGISERLANVAAEEFSQAVEDSLGELAGFLGYQRAAVFLFVPAEQHLRLAQQWQKKGLPPLPRRLTRYSPHSAPMLLERLLGLEKYVARDVSQMPPATRLKANLLEAGIQSFIATPLSIGGELRGALLLAGSAKSEPLAAPELRLIESVALLLANALEKRAVDASLRESERLGRSIIESLAANICVVDREGTLTMVNGEWERFARENAPEGATGLGVGANYLEVCRNSAAAGEPKAAEAAAGIRAVLDGTLPMFSLEYACHAQGAQRWFIAQAAPFSGGGGGAVIAHRDITARVLAAEEVRKSEERYRVIVETTQEGIVGIDPERRITYVNPRILRMLEYEAGELMGRDVLEVIDPEDRELMLGKQEKRRAGISEQYELRYRAKGGARITTITSVSPVFGPEGAFAGAIGMSMDISARVRAEHQIRRSETRYRSLVEAMQEGMIMLKPSGKVAFLNEQFARMLGRKKIEILGRHLADFAVSESRETLARLLTHPGAKQGATEIMWVHSSGRHVYSLISLSANLDETGAVSGFFAIVTDTTERKTLESQLLQSQKLEAIGQLAAGIAHEINTPTQYVGNNTQFIKTAFDDILSMCGQFRGLLDAAKAGPVPAEMIQDVEQALAEKDIEFLKDEVPQAITQTLEGVDRISTIVRSVKQFAHPGESDFAAADLNEAMRSTVTVSRNEWKYVSDLVTELDPELPPVTCMIGEVNQVVLNLIVNAAHAIADAVRNNPDRKGLITLSTKVCGPWAEIRVADTGTGIPQEVQDRIFDPFFTTKEVGKGTGQGLTIARSIIVEKHKGQLFFETEPGVGTTFVVRLPLDHMEEAQ